MMLISGQSKLSFGGPSTLSADCEDRSSETESGGVREESSGSVRASGNFDAAVKSAETTRHFQEIWTHKYPWLRYVPTENKMYCSFCKVSGKNNALAVGTDNFRTSTLSRHVELP